MAIAITFGSLWLATHMGWFAYLTYLLGTASFGVFTLVRRGRRVAYKVLGIDFLLASAFVSAGRGRYPFLTYLLSILTQMSGDTAFIPDVAESKSDKSRLAGTE